LRQPGLMSMVLISIIVPQENYVYFRGVERRPFPCTLILGNIEVQANVLGVDDGVEKVEFYLNGDLVFTDSEAPYSWVWASRHFFRCTVSVKAYLDSDETLIDTLRVWRFF